MPLKNFTETKDKILVGLVGVSASILIGLASSINARLGTLIEYVAADRVEKEYIKATLTDLRHSERDHESRISTLEFAIKPEEVRIKKKIQ